MSVFGVVVIAMAVVMALVDPAPTVALITALGIALVVIGGMKRKLKEME